MQPAHSPARQQIAADAEGFQTGIEAFQMANHFGGVQITGGLAGDDGKLHGRPPAPGCSVAELLGCCEYGCRATQQPSNPATFISAGTGTSPSPMQCRRGTGSRT